MLDLVVGWGLMGALYVVFMRGYKSPVPAKLVRFDYRRNVGGRFGLLPPSFDPIGVALWVVTGAAFLAAIGFFLAGGLFVGASNATMLVAFMITLWRDDKWLKRQPDYLEAIEAASSSPAREEEEG